MDPRWVLKALLSSILNFWDTFKKFPDCSQVPRQKFLFPGGFKSSQICVFWEQKFPIWQPWVKISSNDKCHVFRPYRRFLRSIFVVKSPCLGSQIFFEYACDQIKKNYIYDMSLKSKILLFLQFATILILLFNFKIQHGIGWMILEILGFRP